MKCFAYIRVSTKKQEFGTSLDAQRNAIAKYAEVHKLTIVEWFTEKETAAKQGRTLFSKMIKLIQSKKAEGIIMHKIDRGARNLKDWSDISVLIDNGVKVFFTHENLDMRARGGRLSADIQAVIAADFIRNLKEETVKGLTRRLENGIYPFKAPIGYCDTGRGNLKAIDPIKSKLVQMAFDIYSKGTYSLIELSGILYEKGLKRKNGNALGKTGVAHILKNPYYIGLMKSGKQLYNGHHIPIIKVETFKRVKAILEGKTNTKTIINPYLFKRRIKCETCAYSLIGEKQKGHVYYRCHTKGCPTKTLNEKYIVSQIKNVLKAVELTELEIEAAKLIFDDIINTSKTAAEHQLNLLKIKLSNVQGRLDKLTDLIIDGMIDKNLYESKHTTLLFELKSIEEAISENSLKGDEKVLHLKQYLEQANSLIKSFNSELMQDKLDLLENVTSNLSVQGKKLTMTMKSPFYELTNREGVLKCYLSTAIPRKMDNKIVCSDTITPHKPLSKEEMGIFIAYLLENNL